MTGVPEDGITVDEVDGAGVTTVWLDRPDRANAFTPPMTVKLHRVFADLDTDDAVRCIVVTGRGRYFSAGADLESGRFATSSDDAPDALRREVAERVRPWTMRTPIIGALNGSAVGMGLTLPIQWDIRVMADDAKYGFVFNRRGVMPEFNSLWLLPRLIGLSHAVELLLTGRIFSGSEALALGLANRSVASGSVLDVAREIATEIATNTAPVSTAVTKQRVYEWLGEGDRERAFREEWELFRWLGGQPDAVEGVRAFMEKRPPSWAMPKSTEIPRFGPNRGDAGD